MTDVDRMVALDREWSDWRKRPLERVVLREFRAYLVGMGFVVFRRNVGQFKIEGRTVVVEERGASDLYGLLPAPLKGVHFECEVKRPGGWPTPYQVQWLRMMNAAGARAFWADTPARLVRVVDLILGGWLPVVEDDGAFFMEK